MDTFADYILNEKELAAKMEIAYYLSKKENIFFDKSVVLKTELARLFLKYNKLDLDENLVLTACLLYSCKKIENNKSIDDIKLYAKNGAEYLETLGFDKKFCKVCEEVNRYTESGLREKESDVLELVDQFGGMLLSRPERIGFEPDEALILLIHKNMKDKNNRYTELFSKFVEMLEEINMGDFVEISSLKKLVRINNETEELREFIKKIVNNYEGQIDKLIDKKYREIKREMIVEEKPNNYRSLFTEETTRKILENINTSKKVLTSNEN